MSNIIKYTDIVLATNGGHEGFRVGDYITDKRYESFYVIDGIEERTFDDKHSVTFYNCRGVNPVTLQRDGEDSGISESQLKEYYIVLDGDPTKLRDMCHRILNEGASIEDYAESNETALMTLGNKQSLIALRSQIEQTQRSVALVKNYCHLMQTQMRCEIEKKLDAIRDVVSKMGSEIKRLTYVIQTIETYAGIKEEVLTLQSGEPAAEAEPIVIRQAVLFMDEEFALIDDDFDWRKMESFDKWLVENGNFKTLLPDAKSIVAIKPRRKDKQYAENDEWYNRIMNQPNHVTLFLIRNGDNLYRLESEHIGLEDRMFPNLDEYQKVLEEESRYQMNSDDKRSDMMRRRFTKIAFLLQGLLDRSDVFAPHHVKCSFLKMEGLDESVRMEYELDTSHLLMDGRPSVMDWIKQTNEGIDEGSRILLIGQGDFDRHDFLRYYASDWSKPDYPETGVYTVKKNPQYDPDKNYYNHRRRFCISYMPKSDAYSWTEGPHDRKLKVSIAFSEKSDDILRYDSLNLEDLDYYLNSRIYRSQYFRYVRRLKTARTLIERELAQEREFAKMMCAEIISCGLEPKDGFTREQIADAALQTVKNRLKWKRPISSKERETYTLVRRTLFSVAFKKKYFKQSDV